MVVSWLIWNNLNLFHTSQQERERLNDELGGRNIEWSVRGLDSRVSEGM